ncbi:MAG: murein biosynthesis integral membrane protein MurJ [Lentisphaeria bacterium]|nr:murein biosynthesis integral membrane protein MurJ [Lentisphaeria bacterium]
MSHKKNIFKGMLAGSIGILATRISGLVRDIFVASIAGTSQFFACFVLAFSFVNIFRRGFGEGASTEATIPVFNEKMEQKGLPAAFEFLTIVLNRLFIGLLGISFVAALIALAFIQWDTKQMNQEAAKLYLWFIPLIPLVCLYGFLIGILNSLGKFSLPALAPILINLAIMLGFWLSTNHPKNQNLLLASCLLIGAIAQIFILIPSLRKKEYRWKFKFKLLNEDRLKLRKLFIPAIIGASFYPIGILVDRGFAAWCGAGAVSGLYYAERLVYLPIGVFGVALTAACLPVMSRAFAKNDLKEVESSLNYSIKQILFITLPLTIALFLGCDAIIEVLFLRGEFDQQSVTDTRKALLFYLPGIPAFAALKIIRSGFFSMQDTKTPLKVSLFCIALNIVLNIIFINPLEQSGIALATSISAATNVFILIFLLVKKMDISVLPETVKYTVKLLPAILMVPAIYYGLDYIHESNRWLSISYIALAGVGYLVLSILIMPEQKLFVKRIFKR